MNFNFFLLNQFEAFKSGDFKFRILKIYKLVATALFAPFFIPIILFVRIISPIILIRFDTLFSSRIGHFALNTELYLLRKDIYSRNNNRVIIDISCLHSNFVCNKQLLKMWSREVIIVNRNLLFPFIYYNQFIPLADKHTFYGKYENTRDTENLLDEYDSKLKFLPEELLLGENILQSIGISRNAKVVTLIVRDSAYLNQEHPLGNDISHDYRNSSLINYTNAALYLAELGYYVIRMGSIVKDAFPIKHHNILDYANSEIRSDFLDIYMAYRCCFTISSGTGWDSLPMVFRKPIVFVNIAPIGYQYTFSSLYINITKHYFSSKENRILSIREIFNRNLAALLDTNSFEILGIKLIENSNSEILDVVKEMVSFLESKNKLDLYDELSQQYYWQSFDSEIKSNHVPFKLHGVIKSRVGNAFAKSYYTNLIKYEF